MFSVAIYLVDKSYGGPEEGGWWYTHGTPITDLSEVEELADPHKLPQYFLCEQAAVVHANAVQLELDRTVNKGRRSIGSVLSEGQYQTHVVEGHPAPFPKERPHYE
jgi:hypothetical protein